MGATWCLYWNNSCTHLGLPYRLIIIMVMMMIIIIIIIIGFSADIR